MPEQTNWKAMLRDKKLWIGAAVAGGIGLVVFLKRGGSTQGSVGPGGATGTTPVGSAGYVQGGADTTGTDIAGFLSSYSQALAAQNSEFQGQIKDTLQAFLDGQTGGQTTPNTPNAPDPDPPADTKKYFNIFEGLTFPSFLANTTEVPNGVPGLTLEKLKALNPDLSWAYSKAGVGYVPEGTPGAVPTFGYNARIRIA